MRDETRSIPDTCRELGISTSTVYHYLYADGTLKNSCSALHLHQRPDPCTRPICASHVRCARSWAMLPTLPAL